MNFCCLQKLLDANLIKLNFLFSQAKTFRVIERRLIADLLIQLNRRNMAREGTNETVKQVVASTSTRYSFHGKRVKVHRQGKKVVKFQASANI